MGDTKNNDRRNVTARGRARSVGLYRGCDAGQNEEDRAKKEDQSDRAKYTGLRECPVKRGRLGITCRTAQGQLEE